MMILSAVPMICARNQRGRPSMLMMSSRVLDEMEFSEFVERPFGLLCKVCLHPC
jgi:hypothetical protein